jgi:hypothetical protein
MEEQDYTPEEADRQARELARRLLTTPHKPLKAVRKGKEQPAEAKPTQDRPDSQ